MTPLDYLLEKVKRLEDELESRPTLWAFNQACKALEKHTERETCLEELLREAQNCIWHHHEVGYKLEIGVFCPVCCPDGDPYNGVLLKIQRVLDESNQS